MRKKVRIGELLIGAGVLTSDQLQAALTEQKKRKLKLGRTLIELGFLTEDLLLGTLARQLKMPFVDLAQHSIEPDVVRRLPETHARRFRAMVLEDRGRDLLVGMADPTDIYAMDELERVLKRSVEFAVVRESELLRLLDLAYRRTDEISSLALQLREELAEDDFSIASELSTGEEASSAPVVKLLSSLFEDAVQVRASDIHIEPDHSSLRLRLRVDGLLQEQVMKEKRIAPALVQRLKLMAGLDISEKRIPLDGRFQMKVLGREIDVRLSTMPTAWGESVVMRLLDQSAGLLDLEQLGLPAQLLGRMKSLLMNPHGMLLVTGPTGSGKTTTLYAALSSLNRPETKIITVEDPVEYRLPRIQQVQVNSKIDLSFARVLRAALRQDPDIVMVGEIRDQETAMIGLRAAMTGHLVLSTLHTNDSISSVLRLVDMGAAGYQVATSLRAVLAQRLVRRICEHCSRPHEPDADELRRLAGLLGAAAAPIPSKRGAGCNNCNETGYRGRAGVYELLEVNTAMADALRAGDNAGYVRAAREQPHFRSLAAAALEKVRAGVTTLDEAFRIAGEVDLSSTEELSDV